MGKMHSFFVAQATFLRPAIGNKAAKKVSSKRDGIKEKITQTLETKTSFKTSFPPPPLPPPPLSAPVFLLTHPLHSRVNR